MSSSEKVSRAESARSKRGPPLRSYLMQTQVVLLQSTDSSLRISLTQQSCTTQTYTSPMHSTMQNPARTIGKTRISSDKLLVGRANVHAACTRPAVRVQGSPYSTPLTTGRTTPNPSQTSNGKASQPQTTGSPSRPSGGYRQLSPELDTSGMSTNDYSISEAIFHHLLHTPDLDLKVEPGSLLHDPAIFNQAQLLDVAVAAALDIAYGQEHAVKGLPLLPTASMATIVAAKAADQQQQQEQTQGHAAASQQQQGQQGVYRDLSNSDAAHLFLQRLLYLINRLNLMWYDALSNYDNERSLHLQRIRNAIEAAWTSWEQEQMGYDTIRAIQQMSPDQIKAELMERYKEDVDPPLSNVGSYITQDMGVEGYRQLLAIASLDGLVEASRQSRVCGGTANDVQCMIFKVLSEEYGNGRMAKKHSTFFASMMRELGLADQPEAYLDVVPWQVLAGANHNFLLTERRRHYLRYAGGLTFFEIVGPSVYRTYLAAAQRLNLSENAAGYWALHIKEDERHGRWMVEDVAVPLVDMYPGDGWEVLLGYDQEKSMAQRAADVVLARIREADEKGFSAQPDPSKMTVKSVPSKTASLTHA